RGVPIAARALPARCEPVAPMAGAIQCRSRVKAETEQSAWRVGERRCAPGDPRAPRSRDAAAPMAGAARAPLVRAMIPAVRVAGRPGAQVVSPGGATGIERADAGARPSSRGRGRIASALLPDEDPPAVTNAPAPKNFRRLVWTTLVVTLLVIAWGALVRATKSGAGCGDDWPHCNGQAIPLDGSVKTLIEFTHRVTSGVV